MKGILNISIARGYAHPEHTNKVSTYYLIPANDSYFATVLMRAFGHI